LSFATSCWSAVFEAEDTFTLYVRKTLSIRRMSLAGSPSARAGATPNATAEAATASTAASMRRDDPTRQV
jgi:hypothetical protein